MEEPLPTKARVKEDEAEDTYAEQAQGLAAVDTNASMRFIEIFI